MSRAGRAATGFLGLATAAALSAQAPAPAPAPPPAPAKAAPMERVTPLGGQILN